MGRVPGERWLVGWLVGWFVLCGQTLGLGGVTSDEVSAAQVANERRVERPNVVFAFADDWGRLAGAYAALDQAPGLNSVVQTPHIDRIASGEVLFRHAFVSAPSCTPCRSSLLSGQHFWQMGRRVPSRPAVFLQMPGVSFNRCPMPVASIMKSKNWAR